MKQLWMIGITALFISGMGLQSQADTVNHGDFSSVEIDYIDVTEVTPDSCLFFGFKAILISQKMLYAPKIFNSKAIAKIPKVIGDSLKLWAKSGLVIK